MRSSTAPAPVPCQLHAWRHPRAIGSEGRCIGRTDLPVDPRRAKRLAHRIRALARRQGLPRIVLTSPLVRSRAVGRWLARWGWQHRVDPALAEMDFGTWDGRPWREIAWAEVAAWEADFAGHAPGGGESLHQLRQRVAGVLMRLAAAGRPVLAVGHAGWMNALALHGRPGSPTAADWPAPPRHGAIRVATLL